MTKVVIVGGGWAGCAAAVSARKNGAEVTIVERTDMLLGTGLVGGIMRNNGRYTAAEEMIAMGGGELFTLCDQHTRHKNIEFPGHKHASLYDIATIHGAIIKYLQQIGVNILFKTRINKVSTEGQAIKAVQDVRTNTITGDVFIDATGTAGPIINCRKYGNGCVMCIIRCPSFGGRISLAELAGINEYISMKDDGTYGAMSGSCKLLKESLSQSIQNELNNKGVVIIPIPEHLTKSDIHGKVCQQYALEAFQNNIILLDTGHAKLMTSYYDLETLRKIPGFEYARYEDPYAGGKGNSMRFTGMVPRDNDMCVKGIDNLFCCGEKSGLLVGHTEAIVTGTLAGYNSVRYHLGKALLQIPTVLATGDAIAHVNAETEKDKHITKKYTFSGSVYFERMKEKNLYTTNINEIKQRVHSCQMTEVFDKI